MIEAGKPAKVALTELIRKLTKPPSTLVQTGSETGSENSLMKIGILAVPAAHLYLDVSRDHPGEFFRVLGAVVAAPIGVGLDVARPELGNRRGRRFGTNGER